MKSLRQWVLESHSSWVTTGIDINHSIIVHTNVLCTYSRSRALSLSWPIIDLFGVLICFKAELAHSVVATVTGIIDNMCSIAAIFGYNFREKN